MEAPSAGEWGGGGRGALPCGMAGRGGSGEVEGSGPEKEVTLTAGHRVGKARADALPVTSRPPVGPG